MTFKLYDGPTAAESPTPLAGGTVGPLTVSVEQSLFTADLAFPSSLWNGEDRWLEIVIGAQTLSPRQKIRPAPYAVYTLEAAAGNVLAASDGNPAEAVFVDANGNVGVNTSTPVVQLDVRSASTSAGRIRAASMNADTWVQLWSGHTDGSNDPVIMWSDEVTADDLRFGPSNLGGANFTERMRIRGNGNVGIGLSPDDSAKLHVLGQVWAQGVGNRILSRNPDNNNTLLQLDWFDHATDPTMKVARLRIGGSGDGSANGIAFQRGGDVEMMRITSAGLGIGTVAPTREVEVQGANDVEIGLKSSNVNGRLWTIQSSNPASAGQQAESFQIIDRTANASRVLIDTAGNVGIGTTAPSERLTVNGAVESIGASGGFMFPDGTLQTTASTGGSGPWSIGGGGDIYYNGGEVGIGTTAPTSQLHVRKDAATGNRVFIENSMANAAADVRISLQTGTFPTSYNGADIVLPNPLAADDDLLISNSFGGIELKTTAVVQIEGGPLGGQFSILDDDDTNATIQGSAGLRHLQSRPRDRGLHTHFAATIVR